MPTLPNMGLITPTEGGDDDIWDTILAALFALVDAHDHTTGKGVKIPSAALRINADVPWNDAGAYYALTGVKALDFQPQAAASMASYAGALFVSSADNELYYRTTAGTNVKFTNGAALNVSAFTGGIGGDYSAAGALVQYVDADDAYYFQQQGAPRPWARIRTGDVDIYETAASIVNRIRLKSPAALAASYQLTFAAALPAAQAMLQATAAGQLVYSNALAANEDFTVSGTGEYNHGDKKLSQSVALAALTISGGGFSYVTTGGHLRISMPASSDVYVVIYGLRQGMRVKSVSVMGTSTSEPTFSVRLQSQTIQGVLASTQAGTIVANSRITRTLNAPNTMSGDDDFLIVNMTAGAGAAFVAYEVQVIYDVP